MLLYCINSHEFHQSKRRVIVFFCRKLKSSLVFTVRISGNGWHSTFIQMKWEVYIHLGWSHQNTFFNHSTNFLLTNYSFGKSVRTSTLCTTQVIFPTIVYRQIISLIIVTTIIVRRSRPLSLFWRRSVAEVTGLPATADPLFIFHLFCLCLTHLISLTQ